jgi:ribosomal protein S18 acetylase RimI-like enzyme
MKLEVTATPVPDDEAFVIAQIRAYNGKFLQRDLKSLCVFARDDSGAIIGGICGRTSWNYLEVLFLWVDETQRGAGLASSLMAAAETEARKRGCGHAQVDTFSFQAPGFYQKLGYREFGRLEGYPDGRQRHYLHKSLAAGG